MRLTFTVLGKPATKKNSMRVVRSPRGTPLLLPSKANVSWTNDAVRQLRQQWRGQRGTLPALEVPVSVSYRIYLRDRKHEGDVDNYMAAMNDALQKAGVLANDKLIRCGLFAKSYDATNPRMEVQITAATTEEAA